MTDWSAGRWHKLAAWVAAGASAACLLVLCAAAWRDGQRWQDELDRSHALREATAALARQPVAEGYEWSLRQTLDELLRRRDLGFRFLSLHDAGGTVLAVVGAYERLPLGFLNASMREQLREALYAMTSRFGRLQVADATGSRVTLEYALGAPAQSAIHEAAVARLQRDAVIGGALALAFVVALITLWRRARPMPAQLRQRLEPDAAVGSGAPAQRRQQAALELRSRMGGAFDQLSRAMLVVDRDARVLALNATAERLTGWTAADAIGRPVYSVFHVRGDDREQKLTPAELALNDGCEIKAMERSLRARNGEERPVEVMAALLKDEHGVTEGAVMLFHDVADKHYTMDALRREAQLSQGIIDHLVEGVLTSDRAGVVRFANARASRMFGYSREELEGVTISKLMPVPFLNSPGVKLTDYIASQSGARLPKVIGWRKDATTFPVELVVESMRLGADEGLVVIVRDITERLRTDNLTLRLGRLLDNAMEEVYIFDAQSLYFIEVNRGARRNLGYQPEQLARMTLLSIAPTLDMATFHGYLNRLRGGDLEHLVYRSEHKRADETTYPVEVRLNFSRDEEPPVFMAVATDLTTRGEGGNVVPLTRTRDRR
jgi:PAS domain S-box-containing protein